MESVQDEYRFLTDLLDGLAAQFGDSCEAVLHDLTLPYDSTIVSIRNGHITGRTTGDPGTNLGLELLRGDRVNGNKFNDVTQTKEGRILRSTSVYMRNRAGQPVGALCINFDITSLMVARRTLRQFGNAEASQPVRESFVSNVSDLLEALIREAQEQIGKPPEAMTKEEKRSMIAWLDRKGALLVKKGGERICAHLGISKYTLYNYLEESKLGDPPYGGPPPSGSEPNAT